MTPRGHVDRECALCSHHGPSSFPEGPCLLSYRWTMIPERSVLLDLGLLLRLRERVSLGLSGKTCSLLAKSSVQAGGHSPTEKVLELLVQGTSAEPSRPPYWILLSTSGAGAGPGTQQSHSKPESEGDPVYLVCDFSRRLRGYQTRLVSVTSWSQGTLVNTTFLSITSFTCQPNDPNFLSEETHTQRLRHFLKAPQLAVGRAMENLRTLA